MLVLGSGPVALALAMAHLNVRPSLNKVLLWNRTPSRLAENEQRLHGHGLSVEIVTDLNESVARADVISSVTASKLPLIEGRYVRPGTHVDLVGAFHSGMRESDDELIGRARLYANFREAALGPGDYHVPIRNGTISERDVVEDLFDLVGGATPNRGPEDITVYKNGGGPHLDLIISQLVLAQV